MHEILREINQQRNFVWAENGWQSSCSLRKRYMIRQVWSAQRFYKQKAQCRRVPFHGGDRQLTVTEQVNLILADVFGT